MSEKKKPLKAFGYIRVSTEMQVEEGYSLDNQEYEITEHAKKEGMRLERIYRDEGKSGKNISGRPAFQEMLRDIEEGAEIDYVIVHSLNRFGRNTADVVTALEVLERNGVFLRCIRDMIDSSSQLGKAMVQLGSVFAELDRAGIRETTRSGRYQKAREGKWNGAQAPFGYRLENGLLIIDKDEAEVVKLIFERYTTQLGGIHSVASWLNTNGYRKEPRGNGKYTYFSPNTIKNIIDNPVYAGKIAYGRRQMKRKRGSDNEYHAVKQEKYQLNDGIHEAIISEETFELAQKRRKEESKPFPRKRSDKVNLLTGLLICPVCGRKMVATNTIGKIKKDGTRGKETRAYACKYSKKAFGPDCTFTTQYRQELIDAEIDDVVAICLADDLMATLLAEKYNEELDENGLRDELKQLKKVKSQYDQSIKKLTDRMDTLDVTDAHYDRKYDDAQARQDELYDKQGETELAIKETMAKLRSVQTGQASAEDALEYLKYFGEGLKSVNNDAKKQFYALFIDQIEIYPDADWKHGEDIVYKIRFKIPLNYGGEQTFELTHLEDEEGRQMEKHIRVRHFRDKENTVETVALLKRAEK
jgi:site-specific DNA recombinase